MTAAQERTRALRADAGPRGRAMSRASLGHRLAVHSGGLVGGALLALILMAALLAPLIAPHDPQTQALPSRLKPPMWHPAGSPFYPLGADPLGRDLLSRLIYGARVSLLVAGLATLGATLLGTALGLISGYFGGLLDNLIQRVVEIQLAFPFLLLAITIMGVLPPSVANLILVLMIAGWTLYARVIRGQSLSLRQKDFVQAMHVVGASHARIVVRHLLPNIVPSVIVLATIQLSQFIIAESALSFLGLGVPPSIPSWGGIMKEGLPYIELAWWVETFPGLMIVLTVSGMGLLGDWLRDILDPRVRAD